MLYLFDADRLLTHALAEHSSLITRKRFGEHSEWAGEFPPDDFDALMAAKFCQPHGDTEVYLIEQVRLVIPDGRDSQCVRAEGRSATALLERRVYLGMPAMTGVTAGAAVKTLVTSLLSNMIPAMTSDTAPSGVASASSVYSESYPAYKAFDKTAASYWHSSSSGPPFWLRYDFPSAMQVASYTLMASPNGARFPRSWALQGSADGTTWVDVDTRSNIDGPGASGKLAFTLASPATYRYWRLYVTASNPAGASPAYCVIAEMELIGPSVRAIPGLVFGTGDTLGDTVTVPTDYRPIDELALELVQGSDLGMSVRLSGTDIVLDVVAAQSTDTLIGEKYDNGISFELTGDTRDWFNVALVTRLGTDNKVDGYVEVDWSSGGERRELLVDGSVIERSPGGTAIPLATYEAMLAAYGAGALANHRRVLYAEAETDAAISVGQVVWYDSGRYSAALMASEVTTVIEGGTTTVTATLGTPPPELRSILRRTT